MTAYSQSQPVSYRPTGIYQKPTGFEKGVSDGNPSSPMEMLYVLVNNYKWTCIIPPETSINTNPGETLKPASILLATIEDEAINDNALEYVEYNTDDKNEVDGRILLIKDSNVTDVIEGDLFNTSVLIPNDVDIISFKTEDEAKASVEYMQNLKGTEYYYKKWVDSEGKDYWIVYRKSDDKAGKCLHWFEPDLKKFFTQEEIENASTSTVPV